MQKIWLQYIKLKGYKIQIDDPNFAHTPSQHVWAQLENI